MKRILGSLAGLAVAAAASGALAADLPYRSAPPPAFVAVPVFTWTGFYVGVNAGYGWGDSKTETGLAGRWRVEGAAFQQGWAAASNGKTSPSGFAGGGQIGYNYQMGSWVFGLEIDGGGLDLKKSASTTAVIAGNPLPYTWTRSANADWLLTVRPRLGWAYDRALFYATGGLAVGGVEGNWGVLGQNGYSKFGSKSDTRTGYTVGGGVEYAITPNWSAKVEYLYTDLGKVRYTSGYRPGSTFNLAGDPYIENIRQDMKFSTVKAGLNYKFTTW